MSQSEFCFHIFSIQDGKVIEERFQFYHFLSEIRIEQTELSSDTLSKGPSFHLFCSRLRNHWEPVWKSG